MRTTTVALVFVLCAGCAGESLDTDPPGWAAFDPYTRPDTYTVRRGDTLSMIAASRGVTVADLRAWNGIEGDLIEVDQILLIWAPDPDVRTVRAPAPHGRRVRAVATLAPATVVVEGATRPAGPRLVHDAGVLGAFEDDPTLSTGLDASLADGVGGLEVYGRRGTSSGLAPGQRSGLARAGTAEATGPLRAGAPAPRVTSAPVRALRFVAPAPKPCLAGPTDVVGESGVAAGAGLSERQIRGTLDAFVGHTSACIPAGSTGGLALVTEITVGCDGRVRHAEVVDGGGAPDAVAACVAETLAQAGFPAHDLPDGQTFLYPITYRF